VHAPPGSTQQLPMLLGIGMSHARPLQQGGPTLSIMQLPRTLGWQHASTLLDGPWNVWQVSPASHVGDDGGQYAL
jgi:hypothetical protein